MNEKIGQLKFSSLRNRKEEDWRKVSRALVICGSETAYTLWESQKEDRKKQRDYLKK